MSYQVLARKWRPRTFHELVGQEHVSRALINALDQGRLHHAYLFTGTRGVGKTTLARILAKCLNCESGVTSSPCGQCNTCRVIDEGRFVDLIEVDAASRTRVEDTRELLDNVQYAPTQGRYKVYLIDEVHMLSTHSFNALLKTLEEPPPHVKFLLATTDPQKLPVTVLSRCLQFALKHMTPERVVEHLAHVLRSETVAFDERALWLLGRAADGSMRDALSLTDQAIAFGHGRLVYDDVAAMLGTLDHQHVVTLAEGLAEADAPGLLNTVARLAEQAPDFADVLDALCGVFHRLAIAQMVPQALDNAHGDRDTLLVLAGRFTAEDVQLYYQMALNGRRDMEQAPEPRSALEMVLLRMLAFRPQGVPRPPQTPLPMRGGDVSPTNAGDQTSSAPATEDTASTGTAPLAESTSSVGSASEQAAVDVNAPAGESYEDIAPPWDDEGAAGAAGRAEGEWPAVTETSVAAFSADETSATAAMMAETAMDSGTEEAPSAEPAPATETPVADERALAQPHFSPPVAADQDQLSHDGWLELFPRLELSGMTRNLMAHCVVEHDDGSELTLRLDSSQSAMNAEIHQQRLVAALEAIGYPRRITIQVDTLDGVRETPKSQHDRLNSERRARAVEALRNDPHIQELEQLFDARLLDQSVQSFEND